MPLPVKKDVFHQVHDQGYVSSDTNYFPIIPIWWAGVITPELFDKFWDFRDEQLLNKGAPLVVLVHEINDIKPMPPTTRRYLSEKAKNDEPIQRGEVISVILVSNPLIRGVMTAVSWMAGDKFPMEFVKTIEDGFRVAKQLLERRGVKGIPAIDAASYEIKKNPDAKLD